MVISTHITFVVLLNNGSSLCIQMKSIVSPDQHDAKCFWWTKLDAYNLNFDAKCFWWTKLEAYNLNEIYRFSCLVWCKVLLMNQIGSLLILASMVFS